MITNLLIHIRKVYVFLYLPGKQPNREAIEPSTALRALQIHMPF